ncbi:CLK4-associating serine/arginine rich protein isoform X1 [Ranitomeya imitator]|uniref:CLK4-associating serine/arginine rich protein isoform X1 n=1 Tax=Ranitomeya imitator TaxID=111125 RepID=UPI0037E883FF
MKTGSRMWHEARKHERKLRGMMVDYKKRAERRREYYEKIKKDPAQFLQVHGRFCKIHLDSAVALAAESPVNMMPWQGDPNNMIDRFDVRAHLDYIPEYKPPLLTTISPEQEADDRKCNYERYRGLVQNDFAGISEEQCLYQIYIDELYGGLQRPGDDEKKRLAEKKASIGYTYDDSTVADLGSSDKEDEDSDDESKSDEDEVIPDIDVEVDVDDITEEQVADLNKQATTYGMAEGDFVRMLRKDKEESEAIKHAKALEEEKAMYSGRRSRRQRREFREKRLKGRKISPPSYARRDSPTYDPYRRSQSETSSASRSRSPSQGREEAITFITSFGGSEDESASGPAAQTPATSGNKRAPHSQAPGTSSGRKEASRRRSSSSSSSSSSTTSSSSRTTSRSRSRSRSSSRSRRDSRRRRSTSRSRSRWYSRSPARRYSGGGGIRDSRKYSRSRSPDRDRYYGGRRRSRSRSRSLDRYGRGGKTSGRSQESSQSSISRSPSPNREKGARRTISPAVGERLKRPELAVSRESGAAKAKLTPQEKLKLRMQKALNKQYKADKKAAQEKIIQQEHERQEREDELRAMARKIRMKERERRERERDEWERHYTRSRSPSPRHSRDYSSSKRRSRSRSRSPHHRH